MYDPQLSRIIAEAVSRLMADLSQTAPFMAAQVTPWLQQLAGDGQPEDYFKHPLAFPSLLLPWWLERTIHPKPDLALQADLLYSTINGYYYIRLIDNLMDGHATVELELLPALGFFHTRFQTVYQTYFAGDHPFWDQFSTIWLHSAEVAMQDAGLTEIDEAEFTQIAAQKVCAAKIPLVALCYRYERLDLVEPWFRLVDLLGCWHQFLNDLLGWYRDDTRQSCTYFLAEAARRRADAEPLVSWVAREGFDWATGRLAIWMSALKKLAVELDSSDLAHYLDSREQMLQSQQAEVAAGLSNLMKLLDATCHFETEGREIPKEQQ
jgi:hypothetical protein